MAAFSPLCPPPPLPIPPPTRPPLALCLVFDCVVAGLLTFLSTLALRHFLRRPAPASAEAFFHPYTSDGERVLWCAVRAVQELCPGLPCAVFTGDAGASPDGLAARAIGRLGVRLLRPPQVFEAAFLQGIDQDKISLRLTGLRTQKDIEMLHGVLKKAGSLRQFDVNTTPSKVEIVFDPKTVGLRSVVDTIEMGSNRTLKAHVQNPYT